MDKAFCPIKISCPCCNVCVSICKCFIIIICSTTFCEFSKWANDFALVLSRVVLQVSYTNFKVCSLKRQTQKTSTHQNISTSISSFAHTPHSAPSTFTRNWPFDLRYIFTVSVLFIARGVGLFFAERVLFNSIYGLVLFWIF